MNFLRRIARPHKFPTLHGREGQRGQAAIFMAIFMATMILLFAFSTNVGMLVHAKINLQNAADAAAYAGAAVQARQMTAISYLNYEMRRSVKQFLFNYMVRGNQAQSCFPIDEVGNVISSQCYGRRGGGTTDRYRFAFYDPRETYTNEVDDDYLPTVCIIFDQSNNYCQKNAVAGIPELGGISGVLAFVNPIINQVRTSTQIIIDRKINDCQSRGNANIQYMTAWLFNLDPNPLPVITGNDSDVPFPSYGNIDALGVLVRQALLRARIDNFEEALNLNLQNESFSTATIDANVINQLRSDSKKEYFERPIQAYLSALNNLPSVDQHNGIFSGVKLTELVPHQTSAPKNPNLENEPVLFRLIDIKDDVKLAASKFNGTIVNGERGGCSQQRLQMRVPSFPIGVTKDPSILTFYAVNLKAEARLLFSPFGLDGTVTLSAYSAAKPFGSRIGKNLMENPDQYLHAAGKRVSTDSLVGAFKQQHHYPNILVADTDRYAENDGFATNGNLGYLRKATRSFPDGMARAYRLAGAYSPWEVGFYSVPADFEGISRFANNPNYDGPANRGFFQLRASAYPVKRAGSDLSFLINRIESYFTTAGFLNPGDSNDELNTIKAAYLNPANFRLFEGFLRNLGQDQVHFISNPILRDDPQLEAFATRFGQRYTVAGKQNQLRQLTAWNTTKSSTHQDGAPPGNELEAGRGRAGYSVRFIAFGALTAGGLGSNDGQVQFTDPFARINPGNSEAQKIVDEIRSIKH